MGWIVAYHIVTELCCNICVVAGWQTERIPTSIEQSGKRGAMARESWMCFRISYEKIEVCTCHECLGNAATAVHGALPVELFHGTGPLSCHATRFRDCDATSGGRPRRLRDRRRRDFNGLDIYRLPAPILPPAPACASSSSHVRMIAPSPQLGRHSPWLLLAARYPRTVG